MPPDGRRTILKSHGRDPLLSCRSFPYLPREIRADVRRSITAAEASSKRNSQKPVKTYWYQEI